MQRESKLAEGSDDESADDEQVVEAPQGEDSKNSTSDTLGQADKAVQSEQIDKHSVQDGIVKEKSDVVREKGDIVEAAGDVTEAVNSEATETRTPVAGDSDTDRNKTEINTDTEKRTALHS